MHWWGNENLLSHVFTASVCIALETELEELGISQHDSI